MGDVSIVADLTVLRSKWRHAEALVLMSVRKDVFVADSGSMAGVGRYGAVCRRIRSIEIRSCKEVVILDEFTFMSV